MGKPVTVPGWLVLSLFAVLAANLVANSATDVTIGLMAGVSPFAHTVRNDVDLVWVPLFRAVIYPLCTVLAIAYLWPLVAYFRCGRPSEIPPAVARRAVNGPVVVATIGFAGWLVGIVGFPMLTIARFGRWSGDLMSQQVLSPLVNGFLAATTSYLVVDWVFRTRVVPEVFPTGTGRATDLAGTTAPGVMARLVVFLLAVAFVPLFTMLGLVRATAARIDAGWDVTRVVPELVHASETTFGLYLAVGLVLTALLARTFTRPLAAVTAALRRVRAGTLDEPVAVTSADEIGVLEEGVNALAGTLREKERILQTFGRVVEPIVRDRLLAGDLRADGEIRTASVLFCDLRGFTTFAERTAPRTLVRTLNEFFTTMTAWARACDGFVDKFIGDGLLVVFGLFDDDRESAARTGAGAALRCALGMRERLGALNAERTARGEPPLGMKIGVHSGPVVAGTIGAADRHEYTVVGDTVNVAARLEELCRTHDCTLIISGTTWDLARAAGAALPEAAEAAVTLRGREGLVRAYRVG